MEPPFSDFFIAGLVWGIIGLLFGLALCAAYRIPAKAAQIMMIGGVFIGWIVEAFIRSGPAQQITRTEHTYRHITVDWTPLVWAIAVFLFVGLLTIARELFGRRGETIKGELIAPPAQQRIAKRKNLPAIRKAAE
jgi:hypothetical protein